ncbi:MAG: RecX family transcriptional regulator [Candidatus Omnitrophota bacterium]
MDNLDKAKRCALNLLKYRARTISEMKESLDSKGYEDKVVSEVVDEFEKKGLLNDKKFAQDWARERLEDYFYSFSLIKNELEQKGLDDFLVEDVLADFSKEFSDNDTAVKLIERRMHRVEGLPKSKAKIKLASFLQRRGFDIELIEEVIGLLCG